jgi:hypothetical protein
MILGNWVTNPTRIRFVYSHGLPSLQADAADKIAEALTGTKETQWAYSVGVSLARA